MIRISCPSLPPLDAYIDCLEEIWDSKMLSNYGNYANAFEYEIRRASGGIFCQLVSSCDLGLIITLKAFKFTFGSEIIVPSFTFNSTGNAILWNNCIPKFVDISLSDLNLDLDDLSEKISKKTAAILATNTFGNPSDMKPLVEIAHDHDIPLIFDSAHALGARYLGKPIAQYGDAHVFSFGGTKIVTSGEGGAVVTPHKGIAKRIEYLRNSGFLSDYNGKYLGLNAKMSELNAALGWLNIKRLNSNLKTRDACYKRYKKALKSSRYYSQYIYPKNTSTHPYYTLVYISPKDCSKAKEVLAKHGIGTKQYYFPLHKMDYFRRFNNNDLENTDYIYPRILNLPIHTDMDMDTTDYVTYWVTRALHGRS